MWGWSGVGGVGICGQARLTLGSVLFSLYNSQLPPHQHSALHRGLVLGLNHRNTVIIIVTIAVCNCWSKA